MSKGKVLNMNYLEDYKAFAMNYAVEEDIDKRIGEKINKERNKWNLFV